MSISQTFLFLPVRTRKLIQFAVVSRRQQIQQWRTNHKGNVSRVEAGEYYTHEEVERMARQWFIKKLVGLRILGNRRPIHENTYNRGLSALNALYPRGPGIPR